ncbi:hypothetical protein CEE37_11755 [candidate division LCP-89 bacterium B3_LCP]|uniref:Uncharacterized protein n=1 Tax=candidate division LCP-89 bacterium B3_LCP TaxID=2012998 RepID=A0A532UVW7_UNCL8|nr:MAG: hypothetical protein CEE37_11755 [candidate division LCP-89 bacterium B3_LCP]
MKKLALPVIAVSLFVILLFGFCGICTAAQYDAIVVNDTTGVGIDSVQVSWTFPDTTSFLTYTDTNGKTSVNYNGSSGNTTVSVFKSGYHPVHPASGTINATTSQYRYLFTMLPN